MRRFDDHIGHGPAGGGRQGRGRAARSVAPSSFGQLPTDSTATTSDLDERSRSITGAPRRRVGPGWSLVFAAGANLTTAAIAVSTGATLIGFVSCCTISACSIALVGAEVISKQRGR